MAKLVFTDCRIFAGAADLSGVSNKAEVQGEREVKEVTNFRSGGWKENLAGLGSARIAAEGFWEAGDPGKVDDAAWAALGATPGPWSVCPTDAVDGATVFFTRALTANYAPFNGGVGDVASYKADAQSSWPLVRGLIANPPGTARTASGTGTARQLGAVASGQALYANLHVLSVAGTTPSITVEIESDDAVGFATPISRIAFTAATAVGSQSSRVVGPITDTYFRAKWTVSGTTPSFLAVVTFGIA